MPPSQAISLYAATRSRSMCSRVRAIGCMVTTRAQQAFVDCFLNRYYFNSALHNTYTDHLRFHSLNPLFSGSFRSHAFLTVWVQVNGQTIPLCGMRKSKIRTGALKLGMPSEKSARSGYYDFDSCSRSIYADYLPTSFLNPLKRQHSSPKIWLSAGKQTGPGANAIKASHPRLGEEVIFTVNTQRVIAANQLSASLATASQRACTDMPAHMRLRARMCIELIRGANLPLGEWAGSTACSCQYRFNSILRSIGMRYRAFSLSISQIAKRMNPPVYCPT